MNSRSEEIPIHRPPMRQWELGPEHDRYDNLLAAPSDTALKSMWTWWLVITAVVTASVLVVFIAILLNKKVRQNSFNTYLLFLMVPDLLLSGSCVMTCALNLVEGAFFSEWSCKFQSFYLGFGIGANAWLNGVISWQLHTMLKMSYARRRYKSPSRKQVAFHALCVYAWTGFVASWSLWDLPGWPMKTFLVKGEACVPLEYDRASTIFFYLAFFPAFAGIPLIYVCYVLYDILRHGLLPPTGKRRLLVIYFFRLIAVFTIMWIPALVLIFVVGGWVSPWVTWVGGSWSHFQGAVSAAVSMVKPDIAKAVMDLLRCRVNADQDDSERRSSWRPSGNTHISKFGHSSHQSFVLRISSDIDGPLVSTAGHSNSSIDKEETGKMEKDDEEAGERCLQDETEQTEQTEQHDSYFDDSSKHTKIDIHEEEGASTSEDVKQTIFSCKPLAMNKHVWWPDQRKTDCNVDPPDEDLNEIQADIEDGHFIDEHDESTIDVPSGNRISEHV